MKRRDVMFSLCAGLGLAAVGLSARDARAQRTGTRPIGIASAMTSAGLMVSRVYPGANARSFIVMIRTPRGDRWHRLQLPANAAQAFRAGLNGGSPWHVEEGEGNRLQQFDLRVARAGGGDGLSFSIRRQGEDDVDGAATGGTDGGGTQNGLTFLGALVAIAAMLVGLAALAVGTGTPLSLRMNIRGNVIEISVNGGSETPPPNGGNGFMHEPICDTMPPMLC